MKIDWTLLREIIETKNRFVLTTHVRPDAVASTSLRTLASIPSRGSGPPSSAIMTGSQRIRT